jgi:striatin 1/3/4
MMKVVDRIFPLIRKQKKCWPNLIFLSAHQTNHQKGESDQWRPGASKTDIVDIGELAALTVANESMEMNGGPNTNTNLQNTLNNEFRKTWNPRYILKSHFDCIRCLRFHPTDPLLVTCSEDETLKLWNLNKTKQQSNKGKQQQAPTSGTTYDLEPVYTFRGHSSRVVSMTLSNNLIYSGAQNGELLIWSVPSNISSIDPYDAYDASLSAGAFAGHSDAIWSLLTLESNSGTPLLCSASSDATIKIWDTARQTCIKTISFDDRKSMPTSLAAVSPHNNNNTSSNSSTLIAASFADGSVAVYDIDSPTPNQAVLAFDDGNPSRINSVVVHSTMPVLVSAHEDRQIKFWDLNAGKCLHAMVAHLDEVTCLAVDPNGLYLLSGSHDCSVRLWNFDNRTCVQEITSHRKKFDEAIFDVTFHSSKPFFASAGADGLAKVFV